MAQFIKNRWVKIILAIILSVLLLVSGIIVALQIPAVQTRAIRLVTDYIGEKTGYHITIQHLSLRWLDRLKANEVNIYDLENNLMISASDIVVNYDLRSLIQNDEKTLNFAEINNAEVNARIITYKDTIQNLNLTEFINRLRAMNESTSGGGIFVIDDVVLNNSTFSYLDYRRDTLIPGFNYNNFFVSDVNARVSEVFAHADTLQMDIQSLTANVPSNELPIHKIEGQFRISKKALEFNDIEIHIGKSIIRDTVVMAFESPRDLQDFNHKVNMSAHFKNSLIHTEDLALFVPYLKDIKDQYRLTGNFNGRVDNFSLTNATLSLGKATQLKGIIRMEGLPDVEETFMNYKLFNSYVLIDDLKPYISRETVKHLLPLNHLQLNGQLIGFTNDFVANGTFNTRLGKIESDINVKLSEDINNTIYSGMLALTNFDLGEYANQPKVGMVTLQGNIKGSGIMIDNADFIMEGNIKSLDYNNYRYRNISTNGHFKNKFFEGQLNIDDKNIEVTLKGSIDLRDKIERFNINTTITKLLLKPLNLSQKDIFISGNAFIDAKGLTLDSLIGQGTISNAFVKVDKRSLKIDTLNLFSIIRDQERSLQLYSDLLDLNIHGSYTPSYAFQHIMELVKEYKLSFENNQENLRNYYLNKELYGLENYKANFDIEIKNFNPFLNLIGDSLFVATGTTVEGDLTGGYTSILNLNLKSDSIRYTQNALKETLVDLSISKIADSTDVLAVLFVESEQQEIGPVLKTENLQFESVWNNNHIDFNFYLKQQLSTNYGNIEGNIDFLSDNIQISLRESDILLFDKSWKIPTENLVTFSQGRITFNHLELHQDYQKISFNGMLSRNPDEFFEIVLDSVEMLNFNPILRKPIDGLASGRITFRDIYNNFRMNILASVSNFKVDDFKVGNISGSTFYNDKERNSDITIVVERDKMLIATVQGTYKQPQEGQDELKLNTRVNKAPLNILEPFIDTYFTNISGTASGDFKITGSIKKPAFNGNGLIDSGGLRVNYLNTTYTLNGPFQMMETGIAFNQVQIQDFENNTGIINGNIFHDYFFNWRLDLSANVNNFLVLNTTSKDNELYYGIGYGSGNVSFKGHVNNLMISAQARTEPGTRIFIPIGESGEIQSNDYINFVSFNDSTTIKTEPDEVDLTGFSLDLALDVTTDAYAEIIFDIKSGDIIRGRGEGDLRLQLDPAGEFTMFGDFFIREGGYNFTLYNIINKEFEILPNSRISWYGDPYQGQMDIEATYEQLASLQPLVPQVINENTTVPTELSRKYPSRVLMDLDGPLMSPNIEFDIEVDQLPNYTVNMNGAPLEMGLLFSNFKNSWDEQELNRQVFSLIVLRKFSPLQSFSTGGSLASSVSELLSNQLSYWITQVDENLEIDVDLSGLDQDAFNTFQLRLSYTFLDGRLRVIRDGGVTNYYDNPVAENQDENENKVSGYIGDWTVEYLLTPDGKLRVKMYNRTNYNTDVNSQSVMTAGFSIQHIQSFDQLKDLFRKTRDKEEKESTDDISHKEAIIQRNEVL